MNYSELSKLSVEELRNINKLVVDLIKQKRTIQSLEKKVGLRVGMNVRVNHPKLRGKELSNGNVYGGKRHRRKPETYNSNIVCDPDYSLFTR